MTSQSFQAIFQTENGRQKKWVLWHEKSPTTVKALKHSKHSVLRLTCDFSCRKNGGNFIDSLEALFTSHGQDEILAFNLRIISRHQTIVNRMEAIRQRINQQTQRLYQLPFIIKTGINAIIGIALGPY